MLKLHNDRDRDEENYITTLWQITLEEEMTAEPYSLVDALRRSIRKYRFILLAIATVVGGFALVAYSNLASQVGILQNMSKDIGVALITSGLVGLALEYQTREQFLEDMGSIVSSKIDSSTLGAKVDLIRSQIELKISVLIDQLSLGNELTSLGIRRIYRDRSRINLIPYLQNADPGSEIKLLGISMLAFTNLDAQLTIERKLREGCRFKLLTLEPQSEVAEQRAKEEGRGYNDVLIDMKAADELYMNFKNYRLPEELRRNIEMRHYATTPTWFILFTNKTMLIGPYLSGKRGIYSPQLELNTEESGIYKIFDEHFEFVWNHCQPVPSQDAPA